MSEWHPMSEPPEDGQTVLAWWCNGEQHTGSVWEGQWIPAWENQNKNWEMPDYWMNLPADPKSE